MKKTDTYKNLGGEFQIEVTTSINNNSIFIFVYTGKKVKDF